MVLKINMKRGRNTCKIRESEMAQMSQGLNDDDAHGKDYAVV